MFGDPYQQKCIKSDYFYTAFGDDIDKIKIVNLTK